MGKRRRRKSDRRANAPPGQLGPGPSRHPQPTKSPHQVSVRRTAAGIWELVPPRCALEREDDLAEVQEIIAAGELDVARDELRWLLDGCTDNIAAHELLGEIAFQEQDWPLARGHFGYAFQIGRRALTSAGTPTPVPFSAPPNQDFFAAGKGLLHALLQLDKRETALEVAAFLLYCDPADPLNLQALLELPPD